MNWLTNSRGIDPFVHMLIDEEIRLLATRSKENHFGLVQGGLNEGVQLLRTQWPVAAVF